MTFAAESFESLRARARQDMRLRAVRSMQESARQDMHDSALRSMQESAIRSMRESAVKSMHSSMSDQERMGSLTPCYVFDVDGTLIDVSHLLHLVEDSLDQFHARAEVEAKAIAETIHTANCLYDQGEQVIVLTARAEEWRGTTTRTLMRLGIRFTHLQMRTNGDDRDDVEVKRSGLDVLRAQGLTPYAAWEDKPEVVAMMRAEGLTVTLVTA